MKRARLCPNLLAGIAVCLCAVVGGALNARALAPPSCAQTNAADTDRTVDLSYREAAEYKLILRVFPHHADNIELASRVLSDPASPLWLKEACALFYDILQLKKQGASLKNSTLHNMIAEFLWDMLGATREEKAAMSASSYKVPDLARAAEMLKLTDIHTIYSTAWDGPAKGNREHVLQAIAGFLFVAFPELRETMGERAGALNRACAEISAGWYLHRLEDLRTAWPMPDPFYAKPLDNLWQARGRVARFARDNIETILPVVGVTHLAGLVFFLWRMASSTWIPGTIVISVTLLGSAVYLFHLVRIFDQKSTGLQQLLSSRMLGSIHLGDGDIARLQRLTADTGEMFTALRAVEAARGTCSQSAVNFLSSVITGESHPPLAREAVKSLVSISLTARLTLEQNLRDKNADSRTKNLLSQRRAPLAWNPPAPSDQELQDITGFLYYLKATLDTLEQSGKLSDGLLREHVELKRLCAHSPTGAAQPAHDSAALLSL